MTASEQWLYILSPRPPRLVQQGTDGSPGSRPGRSACASRSSRALTSTDSNGQSQTALLDKSYGFWSTRSSVPTSAVAPGDAVEPAE